MSLGKPTVLHAAVVGLGVMGCHHLRVLDSMEGVEVVAAIDPDETRRIIAARAYRHIHTYASLDDALEAQPVDFCCVAVPIPQLAAVAHAALEAGVHVLVEKPTAHDEQAAAELTRTALRHNLVLGVGHVERCNPAVVALRDRIELVGDIIQMHARRLSPFPGRPSMQGVALDLATHDIDVMRFITGNEVARVQAETTSLHGETAGEDLLCATLRFDDGSTGLLEVNWVTPTKVRQLSVTGTRGMLVVDYVLQDLCFFEHPTHDNILWDSLAGIRGGEEGDMVRYALERREPLRVQWDGFVNAIRTDLPPLVTGEDGLAALSIARAIQQAGQRLEPVTPSYRAMTVV